MPKSVQLCVTILSNSSKVPSSSRNSIRSRADILPSLCWRSWRSLPPPASASPSRRLSSASFCSRFILETNYRRRCGDCASICARRQYRPGRSEFLPIALAVKWLPPRNAAIAHVASDLTCHILRVQEKRFSHLSELFWLRPLQRCHAEAHS